MSTETVWMSAYPDAKSAFLRQCNNAFCALARELRAQEAGWLGAAITALQDRLAATGSLEGC